MAADGAAPPPADSQLFFEDLVAGYTGAPDFIEREWLARAVTERLERPGCRYVLVTGEPGSGKTGLMAALARDHPDWLRYFIRRDSTQPLSGGDAGSLLLRLGHQFATRRPAVFTSDRLEVVVDQRVGRAAAGASVVGVRVEDLEVSPFHDTAVKIQQQVGELAGELVGLEIRHARVEPRLLEPETLQYLALLDPAVALAATDPGARVVVLVDALDEVVLHRPGAGAPLGILDWLAASPELPANVQFVLTSRPHARLSALRAARTTSVAELNLGAEGGRVLADARTFTRRLFADPGLRATGRPADPHAAAERVASAADGNFAYLSAYGRALHGAVASNDTATLDSLLRLETLPTGLIGLYGFFLDLLRGSVEALGSLELDSDDGGETSPWEGVGLRFLSVLAVARAPLALDQLVAFGGVRVYRSGASAVLDRLRPFLDEDGGWRVFHSSLAEFLTSPDAGGPVDAEEWNRRIVRRYRAGAPSWAAVDWTAVDDYGLLHLAEHLVELDGTSPGQVVELVGASLREASRARFGTDLPFQRVVDTALDAAARDDDLAEALCATAFLALVHTGLRGAAGALAPAVLGLMARLGRVPEALARAESMRPGEHRFRSLEAVRDCTPPVQRHLLGPADGADRLVAAALEVPARTGSLFVGLERKNCLTSAAAALGPHDLERAERLAELVGDERDAAGIRDAALGAAAREVPPGAVGALLPRMRTGAADAALSAAERAGPGPLRDALLAAARDAWQGEDAPARLGLLARFVRALPLGAARAETLAQLRTLAESDGLARGDRPGDDEAEAPRPPWGWWKALVDAARTLQDAEPAVARSMLERVSAVPAGSATNWALKQAARLWAEWSEPAPCRAVVESLLGYYRGLGWYGPADDLAELAVTVSGVDSTLAHALVEESDALLSPVLDVADEFERDRVVSKLGGLVQAYQNWDVDRALAAARRMTGSWIPGGPWRTTDGYQSAMASIGLELAGAEPDRAAVLLEECLRFAENRTGPGPTEARYVRGGLFRPAVDGPVGAAGVGRATNFISYLANVVNYWLGGRDFFDFGGPADVLRSIAMPPGTNGAVASWAGAVAALAPAVAVADPDRGISLAGRLANPAERVIACAGLAAALGDDARRPRVLAALRRAVVDLPVYRPELDLAKIPQEPVLEYLNPSLRARFEASLVLGTADDLAGPASALAAAGSGYLEATIHAELQYRWLLHQQPGEAGLAAAVSDLLDAGPRHDPLQADMVRAAAAWGLAAEDPDAAASVVASIESPALAAVGRLLAAAASAVDVDGLLSGCRAVLDEVDDRVSRLHRAGLASLAWQLLAGTNEAAATAALDWGSAAVRDGDSLSAALGLAALADVVDAARAMPLLRESLTRALEVDNPYRGTVALTRLLAPAVRAGDAGLVVELTRRLTEMDRVVFADAVRQAAVPLVAVAGPAIADRLHDALAAGQRVVAPHDAVAHVDGVLPAGAAPDAWLPTEQDEDCYQRLFLDQDDIPGMQRVQDFRFQGPHADDDVFEQFHGSGTGFVAWMAAPEAAVWRLVDIRFVFPNTAAAAAYHAQRLGINSEGNPPVHDAPAVGEECHVFGGTRADNLNGTTVTSTWFFYVFRVGPVVVKLFAAQGPTATPGSLTPAAVAGIAERVIQRITTHLGG